MEYVFGTKGEAEVLCTKGGTHTDLSGYHQIERVYPDQTITDYFRIVRKLNSKKDEAGNCYDWYEIDRHSRYTDKTGPVVAEIAQMRADLENALCEMDLASEERLAAIEDALCELDAG